MAEYITYSVEAPPGTSITYRVNSSSDVLMVPNIPEHEPYPYCCMLHYPGEVEPMQKDEIETLEPGEIVIVTIDAYQFLGAVVSKEYGSEASYKIRYGKGLYFVADLEHISKNLNNIDSISRA